MQLASRLRHTSLGDLLATLHRSGASGVLELIEPHGRHAIHLRQGRVCAVESTARAARLGDLAVRTRAISRPALERARLLAMSRGLRIGQALVATQLLTPRDLDALLATQQRERLEHLYALPDAEVRFRVARPLPREAAAQAPLTPREVFFGRPRARAGERSSQPPRASARPAPRAVDPHAPHLATLGLAPGAAANEIRAAYRRLVLELHPDRQPDAPAPEQAARTRRLMTVVDAYRQLAV